MADIFEVNNKFYFESFICLFSYWSQAGIQGLNTFMNKKGQRSADWDLKCNNLSSLSC